MHTMSTTYSEYSDTTFLVEDPLVSVVMITYNHEPYIAQAIEGVVSQETDFPIELIIGEDCSTDRTREIVLEFQRRYPEIIRVLFSGKNVGMQTNGTRTILAARGEYMAICEGDDWWHRKDKLQIQIPFFLADNSLVFQRKRSAYFCPGSSHRVGKARQLCSAADSRRVSGSHLRESSSLYLHGGRKG